MTGRNNVLMKFAKRKPAKPLGKGCGKNKNQWRPLSPPETHIRGTTAPHAHPNDTKSTNYNKWLSFSELQHQSGHCAELIEETHVLIRQKPKVKKQSKYQGPCHHSQVL